MESPWEFAEEVFVDSPKRFVVDGGGNLGDFLEQFLSRVLVKGYTFWAGRRQAADCVSQYAHGVVDLHADVRGLGKVEQEFEPSVGREVEDALGVISSGLVHARATAGRGGDFFQLGALGSEPGFGKAQKDDAKDRAGVFLRLETGVGAELIGGVPESFLEGAAYGVFFRRGDPVH